MLGIALPADHPVWTAEAQPLPVEAGDTLRAIVAPGWIVAGTRDDGIVRVVNHGTDHAVEGATGGDSPLYARLGYSTATSPVLDEDGWDRPVDQSVVLIDGAGRSTHRTGMRTLTIAASRTTTAGSSASPGRVPARTGWTRPPGQRDHGSGRTGQSCPAAQLTVYSLVRRAWEVRLARVDELADGVDAAALRLRVGGWPVAGPGAVTVLPQAVTASTLRHTSRLRSLSGNGIAGVTAHSDGGPLGGPTHVPWLDHPVRVGAWIAVLVELCGTDRAAETQHGRCDLDVGGDGLEVGVDWPDGIRTRTRLIQTRNRDRQYGDPATTGPAVGAQILKGEG